VAWLRPAPVGDVPDPLDEAALLVAGLRASYDIEVIDASRAHDVVWRHAREPFDRFVHELDDSPAHAFVAPYAVHYPGVLRLRGLGPRHTRAIAASRTVVVGDEGVAATLADRFPGARFATAPIGLPDGRPASRAPFAAPTGAPGRRRPLVGLLDQRRAPVLAAAAERARQAGAEFELLTGPPAAILATADVVVVIDWPPPPGPPVGALAAMAAGRPVIVLETLATAGWPALDPQTWQPRGYGAVARGNTAGRPIAVSLDPLDEEHSLMLALRRLTADAGLRDELATAGAAWWQSHATMDHALEAWRRILDAPPPPAPGFAALNHTEHARTVLDTFSATVDFL
jgi:hypothetical protein